MRRALLVACAIALLVTVPRTAFAWGAAAHELITRRAIDLLPPEMKPFYEHVREELVLRSNDPDLWRNVPWDDDSNHFVDLGIAEFGKPPFAELPRERGAALAKFGAGKLKRWGTLPWRVEEIAGSLRRGFDGMARQGAYSRLVLRPAAAAPAANARDLAFDLVAAWEQAGRPTLYTVQPRPPQRVRR
jgi:hypothetical protein